MYFEVELKLARNRITYDRERGRGKFHTEGGTRIISVRSDVKKPFTQGRLEKKGLLVQNSGHIGTRPRGTTR